jgi:hypothetical protein
MQAQQQQGQQIPVETEQADVVPDLQLLLW